MKRAESSPNSQVERKFRKSSTKRSVIASMSPGLRSGNRKNEIRTNSRVSEVTLGVYE